MATWRGESPGPPPKRAGRRREGTVWSPEAKGMRHDDRVAVATVQDHVSPLMQNLQRVARLVPRDSGRVGEVVGASPVSEKWEPIATLTRADNGPGEDFTAQAARSHDRAAWKTGWIRSAISARRPSMGTSPASASAVIRPASWAAGGYAVPTDYLAWLAVSILAAARRRASPCKGRHRIT